MTTLLSSGNDWTGLILRLTAGLIIFPHGAQHLLGWFGGFGYKGFMNFLTETHHLPWLVAVSVILIEFFGSLFLIAGLGSRLWAIAMIVLMLGIIFSSHIQHGFFMNWPAIHMLSPAGSLKIRPCSTIEQNVVPASTFFASFCTRSRPPKPDGVLCSISNHPT